MTHLREDLDGDVLIKHSSKAMEIGTLAVLSWIKQGACTFSEAMGQGWELQNGQNYQEQEKHRGTGEAENRVLSLC